MTVLNPKKNIRYLPIFLISLLVSLILGLAVFKLKDQQSRAAGYQAVFLSNDQVFFGKLKNRNSAWPALTDVYYLKNQDPDTLVKLGTELHQPKDEMKLNREQILFIEDLPADSQVVKAILESKNK